MYCVSFVSASGAQPIAHPQWTANCSKKSSLGDGLVKKASFTTEYNVLEKSVRGG